jgi:carbonic anhydrase
MLLNHTGCGFTTFTDDDLNARLTAATGDASPAPMRFFSYRDPVENTRAQIEIVRSHPWIARDVPVRGFVLAMATGLLAKSRRCDGKPPPESSGLRRGYPT